MLRGYPRYKAFYSLNFNYFHILFVLLKYFFYLCKMEDLNKVFTDEEEKELQRLVRKIKWNQPTIEDMKKADELTRKKWKAQDLK